MLAIILILAILVGQQVTNRKGSAMAQWDEQFSKLKQIIEMMKDHNLAEIQIKQGEEELCVKKAQPVQQITAVPMFGAGMPGALPGARGPCGGAGAGSGTAGG